MVLTKRVSEKGCTTILHHDKKTDSANVQLSTKTMKLKKIHKKSKKGTKSASVGMRVTAMTSTPPESVSPVALGGLTVVRIM